jgi:hypothetical protein
MIATDHDGPAALLAALAAATGALIQARFAAWGRPAGPRSSRHGPGRPGPGQPGRTRRPLTRLTAPAATVMG